MACGVRNMVYAGLGALLFCFYIIMDLQLIVGGKHSKLRQGVWFFRHLREVLHR